MIGKKTKFCFWKDNWHWIVFILFLLTFFPYILNYFILSEKCWEVVGGPIEWLAFWPSYLSALASSVMIGFTARTLKNNQDQLDELKRQWDEEHKPNVSIAFNKTANVAYLRIVNTSNVEIVGFSMKAQFFTDAKTKREDIFNLNLLEQLQIDIEPKGIRNVILNSNVGRIDPNNFFLLKLYYNGKEQKEIRVCCSEVYLVGDDIVWQKLIDLLSSKK